MVGLATHLTAPTAGLAESRKDVREAARLLAEGEIRYLVDSYYQVQEFRKAGANMARSLEDNDEPNQLVGWLADSQSRIEQDIKIALDAYVHTDEVGQWAVAQHGIGPVLAAGLLANIPVDKTPYAGALWSFAGLTPHIKWEKGKKRPFNANLKRLCWLIGDSFVKTKASEKAFYGRIYEKRKALEVQRNEAGEFADQARATLEEKKIRDKATKAIYEAGKLPPGRIDLRARRIAVKVFLFHYLDVLHWYRLGKRIPPPYAVAHMGHHDEIQCPMAPWNSEAV